MRTGENGIELYTEDWPSASQARKHLNAFPKASDCDGLSGEGGRAHSLAIPASAPYPDLATPPAMTTEDPGLWRSLHCSPYVPQKNKSCADLAAHLSMPFL